MFSQSSRRFGSGQEPWFRIGTLDIGSAGILSALSLLGLFLTSFEGRGHPVTEFLFFRGGEVVRGEFWRFLTWVIPNDPSIWTILSIVMIYFFGSQVESALGRERMAKFLGVLIVLPGVVVLALYLFGVGSFVLVGARFMSSALFYAFVAMHPGARFFFGIPGWVIAAVFLGLEALQYISLGSAVGFLFLFFWVGGVLIVTKAFGLANEIPWIPDLRSTHRGVSGGSRPSPPTRAKSPKRPRRGRSKKSAPPIVAVDQSFEEMGIDEILDQISAFGMDSLNAAQRKKLEAYSKGRRKGK